VPLPISDPRRRNRRHRGGNTEGVDGELEVHPIAAVSQISRADILGRLASREGLRGLNLIRADLAEVCMAGVDLTGANLRMADLTRADLAESRLTSSHLSGATLKEANMVGANLVEANMIGVSLQDADLSRADVSGADLTGANLERARLVGTYLVGAFLNETCLQGADLSGAYVRMAQLAGSNMVSAQLDGADLSQADLSGVHLESASLVGARLVGACLSGGSLTGCDMRDADLSGADLSGCNLSGTKLHGMKYAAVKLDDAWADWVDLSDDGSGKHRATLEEAFADIIGKPMAQILIEGHVSEEAWAEMITHLAEFQAKSPVHADVRLRAIQQGVAAAVLYLEADSEASIAAYLGEFARIVGRGSVELLAGLQATADVIAPEVKANVAVSVGSGIESDLEADPLQLFEDRSEPSDRDFRPDERYPFNPGASVAGNGNGRHVADAEDISLTARIEVLKRAGFWACEKGFAIVTQDRRVWLEAVSTDSLTLRPPHGVVSGIDLVRGRFIAGNSRKR
jgi:uncharacterized protein YjbI with pentapeptide repeats